MRAAFDPVTFVESFWSDTLLPAKDQAVDLPVLLSALREDPKAARERFSHYVGLSNTHYYFVRGEGRLLQKEEFVLKLSLDGAKTDVVIEAAPVFGNTVRDGSGLLDVNDFPNSQKFNLISAELNQRVETVLNSLWDSLNGGETLRFLGCVEVINPETDHFPLTLVPVMVDVE